MLSVLSNHVWSFDCYEEIFQSISKQWGESENKIYNILAGGYELFFLHCWRFVPSIIVLSLFMFLNLV